MTWGTEDFVKSARQPRHGSSRQFCAATIFRTECPLWVISGHFVTADVRFTPKSGHSLERSTCPLCAISGLMHCSKKALIDQSVDAADTHRSAFDLNPLERTRAKLKLAPGFVVRSAPKPRRVVDRVGA